MLFVRRDSFQQRYKENNQRDPATENNLLSLENFSFLEIQYRAQRRKQSTTRCSRP